MPKNIYRYIEVNFLHYTTNTNSPKPWRVLETTFLLIFLNFCLFVRFPPLHLDQTYPKPFNLDHVRV